MSFITSFFKKLFSSSGKKSPSSKTEVSPKSDFPASEAFFSPGPDCMNCIIDSLNQAKKSVDICVFTISDDRISKAIVACHTRNVKVRVLTDDEKSSDLGSDIGTFSKKGISVKTDRSEAHLHHKFMIVDKKILVNGSYNWTRSAADFNEENLVLTYEPGLIRAFSQEFEQLWKKCEDF